MSTHFHPRSFEKPTAQAAGRGMGVSFAAGRPMVGNPTTATGTSPREVPDL